MRLSSICLDANGNIRKGAGLVWRRFARRKSGPYHPYEFGRKIEFYKVLVAMGFKEIESAGRKTEFEFLRYLVDHDLIPWRCRPGPDPGPRTHHPPDFEALKALNAIVHVYNSTSLPASTRFSISPGINQIAVEGQSC